MEYKRKVSKNKLRYLKMNLRRIKERRADDMIRLSASTVCIGIVILIFAFMALSVISDLHYLYKVIFGG